MAGRAWQYKTRSYVEISARLAANARRIRRARGLSQEEAAARCRMSVRMIQRIEGGRPPDNNVTLTALARLCEGLAVDPAELLAPPRLR